MRQSSTRPTAQSTAWGVVQDLPSLGVVGTVRELVREIARFRPQALLLVAALLVDVAYDAVFPLSLGFLIDRAIGPGDSRAFVFILTALALAFVVVVISAIARDYLYAWLGSKVLHDIRVRLFTHLQRMSMDFFGRARAGDLVAHFSTDLASIEHVMVEGLPGAFLSVGSVVVSTALLFALQWKLALLILVALPFAILAPRILGQRALDAGNRKRHDQGVVTGMVHENLQAQRVIKAFSLRDSAVARFGDQSSKLARHSLSFGFYAYSAERAPNIGMGLVEVLVLAVGGYLALQGEMTVGTLIAFKMLLANVTGSVITLSSFAPTLLSATNAIDRVQALLNTPTRMAERPDSTLLPPLRRGIRLENVGFTYAGGRRGLDGVSLEIPKGWRVAFVGPSGCGKSTCLSLIMRFFDPDDGRVLFDGADLRGATVDSISAQIGVVFQDSVLFNATIRENVALGRPGATDTDVEAACRMAELHDAIVAMPRGYDTLVGEGGGRLSGGQRQRVAIARALIRKPSILVLDEATSALDPTAEAAINATLGVLARQQTTITVTHRLDPLVGYDRIFVFQSGRVVESGTHHDLMTAGRLYADMWSKQHSISVSEDSGGASIDPESLRRAAIFRDLDDATLAQVAGMFTLEERPSDMVVFAQGDAGDRFYVVVRGRVRVTALDAEGTELDLGVLQDGDNFGEVALWEDAPRNATVTTEVQTVFLTLRRAEFQKLLDRNPGIRSAIREQIEYRRGASASQAAVG